MSIPTGVVTAFAVWGLISLGMQIVYLYQVYTTKPAPRSEAEIENSFLKQKISKLEDAVEREKKRAQEIEDKVVGRLLAAKTQTN